MNAKPAMSFLEKEKACEYNYIYNGPYWHMCTDGNSVPVLFSDSDDMKFMMNLTGICSRMIPRIKVITFFFLIEIPHQTILHKNRQVCRSVRIRMPADTYNRSEHA